MDTKGCQLRTRFIEEAEEKGPTAQMLIVAVKLPKGNTNVQIVGFMFV
jgi:hypothetical protein